MPTLAAWLCSAAAHALISDPVSGSNGWKVDAAAAFMAVATVQQEHGWKLVQATGRLLIRSVGQVSMAKGQGFSGQLTHPVGFLGASLAAALDG